MSGICPHEKMHQRVAAKRRLAKSECAADELRLARWPPFNTDRGRVGFRHVHSFIFIVEVVKNKQADRRGQIALFACTVDLSDQCRQRHLLGMRDSFQVSPEGAFQTDAGLVSVNYDGTFDNRGFH